MAEYHKDQNIEVLADLLEVIYAATEARGFSVEELENMWLDKLQKEDYLKKDAFNNCNWVK